MDNNDNLQSVNDQGNCCPFYEKAFKTFYNEDKKIPILFHSFNYYKLKLETKIIHRRVIWSFSKQKILENPLLGHGMFSSRAIGDQHKIKNHNNKMLSAMCGEENLECIKKCVIQPPSLKTNLYPHQLTAISMLEEREEKKKLIEHNKCIL